MEHAWIETYGPWAVLLGGVLEGETVFIAAGYAISQGYMDPATTFLLAVAGGSMGDIGWYLLGRWYGPRIIRAIPFLQKVRARATLFLRRWGRAASFLMRFAYGLRSVLPVSIGAARYRLKFFLPFNLLGSATFAAVYLVLGYLFGEAFNRFLGRVDGLEPTILLGIALIGLILWTVREWRLFHSDGDAGKHPTG